MLESDRGHTFDEESAKRIARTVISYEKETANDRSNRRQNVARPGLPFIITGTLVGSLAPGGSAQLLIDHDKFDGSGDSDGPETATVYHYAKWSKTTVHPAGTEGRGMLLKYKNGYAFEALCP